MTGDTAISIDRVSKRYRLGTRESFRTLRETLARTVAAPWRRLRGGAASATGELWALRDVSFDVRRGEVVGLVGRNGAGKSTLLKLLSRITRPTAGRIGLRGRVGSLLEVGTGFHPELTGRENIFLNGAILGMRRREIAAKFDAIVAFSEIEAFLDTPVKRYSSGMYMRLAFAVAAHLEPEILVVDEVLAVGDAAFQRKCLGKMNEVARGGRTVLFVSHNMAAVSALCERAVLLEQGTVVRQGAADEVVRHYLSACWQPATADLSERTDRGGRGGVRLTRLEVCHAGDDPARPITVGQPVRFRFHLAPFRPRARCKFTLYDECGQAVAAMDSPEAPPDACGRPPQPGWLDCEVDELLLRPGRYRVNVNVSIDRDLEDRVETAATFVVEAGPYRGRRFDAASGTRAFLPHYWRRSEAQA